MFTIGSTCNESCLRRQMQSVMSTTLHLYLFVFTSDTIDNLLYDVFIMFSQQKCTFDSSVFTAEGYIDSSVFTAEGCIDSSVFRAEGYL